MKSMSMMVTVTVTVTMRRERGSKLMMGVVCDRLGVFCAVGKGRAYSTHGNNPL